MHRLQFNQETLDRDVAAAVRLLARWPGVRRVWLFGSAARSGPLDWRSDLDLAVEGLPATDHGRAWAELDETLAMPVDLVRWETANPTLRQQVEQWGRLLWERGQSSLCPR
jgi:predicted nucleotidyltransferase